ncbi:MAG: methylenetetrahydrofolate reductase [NAD(P)H] [Gammaproteobacteria bacterium 28-57-27]|nr:MAG: methylenetetrahydrofolate reductase [NAD(P)H] [Gammaproteobacteria bacterium 28-57-27]
MNTSLLISCEFFPPKTDEGARKLRDTWQTLKDIDPEYFSVTYGAGGSTQERSFATVSEIQRDSGIPAAPHLSCIGSTREHIRAILDSYKAQGIRHIVALRGDLPSGMRDPGELRHANELVEFIRAETGDWFHIEVAAYPEFHPQAASAQADLDAFQRKVEAGADSAITQYFYNVDSYLRFMNDCLDRGIHIPIVPGIMPITNFTQLARFSDACGAEIPRWLRKRLETFGDDLDGLRSFGLDVVGELCQQLIEAGAPGLHFYSMNQVEPTLHLWCGLNLRADMEL